MIGWLREASRRFWRREEGTATIEFVIIGPILITFFLMTVESGVLTVRQVMLERGLDIAVRQLRLSTGTDLTRQDLEQAVCNAAVIFSNCRQTVKLEIRNVDTSTTNWASSMAGAPDCIDLGDIETDDVTVAAGQENRMAVIRACALFKPLFPTSGLGLSLNKDSYGAYRLVSTTTYVYEPNS